MSVLIRMAPIFSNILRGLALIFPRMFENLIVGSLGEVNFSGIFQIVLKMLPCYE